MFSSDGTQVASNAANYIEDVFSTWLCTGNGTSRTVTGPDMTAGGLSITKSRSAATGWHWVDTARGAGLSLSSNTTSAQATESTGVTAFTTTGTSIGSAAEYNTNGATYVDYLLKKQPKFFDVVTYTGNGTSGLTVAHSLGSVPGCIIVKRTDSTSEWPVYHQGIPGFYQGKAVFLNQTYSAASSNTYWNGTSPTATNFTLGNSVDVNASGGTYVAYVIAHNAGGFGLTGTDNVISCGSYTTDASAKGSVTLGFEPQFIIAKSATSTGPWCSFDNMRGLSLTASRLLVPNASDAESPQNTIWPTATGFVDNGTVAASATIIYIAIRRGPMKVPTDGTKVFAPVLGNNVSTIGNSAFTTNFVVDSILRDQRSSGANAWMNRLTGATYLRTSTTNAEASDTNILFDAMKGVNSGVAYNWTGTVGWNFQRAPGFFDEVCYTGMGGTQTLSHNLGVAPELAIVKDRSQLSNWTVCQYAANKELYLDSNIASPNAVATIPNPTATTIQVKFSAANLAGDNFVLYLFASCPGVSKVFSYTGNGTSQTIGCGFTAGARFVLIKRTDSTGDWYVWDTARGIVSGNDPHLSLNTTAAEVTTDDTIDPDSSGFVVNQLAATNCNVSGATYIGLAIA